MEYEIGDDPQGLPDEPEGDRDGGLPDKFMLRQRKRLDGRISPRDMALEQMGEPA